MPWSICAAGTTVNGFPWSSFNCAMIEASSSFVYVFGVGVGVGEGVEEEAAALPEFAGPPHPVNARTAAKRIPKDVSIFFMCNPDFLGGMTFPGVTGPALPRPPGRSFPAPIPSSHE
jgi:hypothetical protein